MGKGTWENIVRDYRKEIYILVYISKIMNLARRLGGTIKKDRRNSEREMSCVT